MIRLLLLAWVLLACTAMPARADDNRPLTIVIEQGPANSARVTWKIPANVAARHVPALSAGPACTMRGAPRSWSDPMGHWREMTWQCPTGIVGHPISITYPFANPNLATIIRFRPDGATDAQTIVLQPQDSTFTLQNVRARRSGFAEFLVLGMEHIWIGFDHLLFVAGLIFIAGSLRRVLATVTGFTIAHSITLALAALDLVRLPIAAVEGVIALSIIFLAVEIVKGPRDTLTWRKPIVVASAFGLLHGFGFAAVLREIGLPGEGLVTALFAFNVGIELGQVAFATFVMLLFKAGHRLLARTGDSRATQVITSRLAGYAVGTLASFWMFQRLVG